MSNLKPIANEKEIQKQTLALRSAIHLRTPESTIINLINY